MRFLSKARPPYSCVCTIFLKIIQEQMNIFSMFMRYITQFPIYIYIYDCVDYCDTFGKSSSDGLSTEGSGTAVI